MSLRGTENVPVSSHTHRQGGRSRRSHGKVLVPLADSSEEDPSPHSSIYEAPLASDSETEGIIGSSSGKRSSGFIAVSSRSGGVDTSRDDELGGEHEAGVGGGAMSRSSDQRRSIRISQGLETIVETKRKDAAMRQEEEQPAVMRLDRRSSSEFSEDDEDDDDGDDSSLLRRQRRKKAHTESSRSDYFDDYYHDDDEVYDYASPSQPLYQSISALNNADSPLAGSPMLGGTPPISASFFNRNYSPSSPIRTPLQGPTFRPPVSGYRSYGTLTNHPFHNAPLARGDRGDGTSSLGGIGGYSATGASTPDSLRSGARSRAASVAGSSAGDKWGLWSICGIFCCLGRREQEEAEEEEEAGNGNVGGA